VGGHGSLLRERGTAHRPPPSELLAVEPADPLGLVQLSHAGQFFGVALNRGLTGADGLRDGAVGVPLLAQVGDDLAALSHRRRMIGGLDDE